MGKRVRTGDGVDGVSGLPDDILHHIQSYLPTPDAVRTSVLSSRWRYLWINMPYVWLSDYNVSSNSKFKEVANMALLHREPSCALQGFTLISYTHSLDQQAASAWIYYAVRHKLRHFILIVGKRSQTLCLQALFNCQTLQVLRLLFWKQDLCLPRHVCLSQLREIHLMYIHFKSPDPGSSQENNLERLIAGCPLLEHLSLNSCSFQRLNIKAPQPSNHVVTQSACFSLKKLFLRHCGFLGLNISAPNLEHLYIIHHDLDQSFTKGDEEDKIILSTPNLRSIYYGVSSYKRFIATDLIHLIVASVKLDNASTSECMHSILKACCKTHVLKLSAQVMKHLHIQESHLGSLPTFHNLRKLELFMLIEKGSFQATSYLLSLSPNLSELSLTLLSGYHNTEDENGCWKPNGTLLDFSHHLVTVKIIGFMGSTSELEFLNFLKATANALENVEIVPAEHEIREK